MPFEISCVSCGTVVRTSGFRISLCPSCSTPMQVPRTDDRRSARDIPSVREWVTNLRLSGADFSPDAAIAAREAAWNARRGGGSTEDAFQSARLAYYAILDRENVPVG